MGNRQSSGCWGAQSVEGEGQKASKKLEDCTAGSMSGCGFKPECRHPELGRNGGWHACEDCNVPLHALCVTEFLQIDDAPDSWKCGGYHCEGIRRQGQTGSGVVTSPRGPGCAAGSRCLSSSNSPLDVTHTPCEHPCHVGCVHLLSTPGVCVSCDPPSGRGRGQGSDDEEDQNGAGVEDGENEGGGDEDEDAGDVDIAGKGKGRKQIEASVQEGGSTSTTSRQPPIPGDGSQARTQQQKSRSSVRRAPSPYTTPARRQPITPGRSSSRLSFKTGLQQYGTTVPSPQRHAFGEKSEIATAVKTSMADSVESILKNKSFENTLTELVTTKTFEAAVQSAAERGTEPPSKKALASAVKKQVTENGARVTSILDSSLKPQIEKATKGMVTAAEQLQDLMGVEYSGESNATAGKSQGRGNKKSAGPRAPLPAAMTMRNTALPTEMVMKEEQEKRIISAVEGAKLGKEQENRIIDAVADKVVPRVVAAVQAQLSSFYSFTMQQASRPDAGHSYDSPRKKQTSNWRKKRSGKKKRALDIQESPSSSSESTSSGSPPPPAKKTRGRPRKGNKTVLTTRNENAAPAAGHPLVPTPSGAHAAPSQPMATPFGYNAYPPGHVQPHQHQPSPWMFGHGSQF